MVFLGVVPLGFAVFGNYLIPFANRRQGHGFPQIKHVQLLVVFLPAVC